MSQNIALSGQEPLSVWMWEKSQDLANEALNTEFIQGIKNGNLDPGKYGGYMVQDVKYLASQRDNFAYLITKSSGDIKRFFEKTTVSYGSYTDDYKKAWYISDENGIAAGEALQEYLDHYKSVAEDQESIYSAVAMMPCERLWWWLANKIKDESVKDNVYQFWINENAGSSGGKAVADMVDKHQEDMIKEEALKIFRESMAHEVAFFKSATAPQGLQVEQ